MKTVIVLFIYALNPATGEMMESPFFQYGQNMELCEKDLIIFKLNHEDRFRAVAQQHGYVYDHASCELTVLRESEND